MRIGIIGIIVLILTFSLSANEGFASLSYAGGAAAYLAVPAHAQAAALSGATTAWRECLAGLQNNPAVLDAANGYSLFASFALASDARKQYALDAVIPTGSFLVAGISFVNTGLDNIERRDEAGILDPNNTYFSDQENAFAVSAAGRIPMHISLGIRARYLNQVLDKSMAHGIGFDGGATWGPDSFLCVGASVLNALSRLWWPSGHTDDVLTQGRIGVACRLLNRKLIIELDGVKTVSQPLDIVGGVEYTFAKIVSLRLGALSSVDYYNNWMLRDPVISAGLGLRYAFFGFDYSITIPSSDPALMQNRFTLVLMLSPMDHF
jgi:hypothetical protein